MTRSNKRRTIFLTTALMALASASVVAKSTPKFTITPALGTSGNVSVTPVTTATITYTVTRNLPYTGKSWELQPYPGVTQITTGEGACPVSIVLHKGESCLLILSIDGASPSFPQDTTTTPHNSSPGVSTLSPLPQICRGSTILSCSQPKPANILKVTNSPLGISLSTLVIAQQGIFTAASGAVPASSKPRKFTITNRGSAPVTIGTNDINFSPALSLSGASYTTNCITTLAPSAMCTVTITPGAPSLVGAPPATNTMTVSSHLNASPMATIVTLTYGSLYGDGYVFSIDDSTPDTQSVGPVKVAAPKDQSSTAGFLWNAPLIDTSIWGIDELSTHATASPNASTPSPNTATRLFLQQNCQGNSEGACNTFNVAITYSLFLPNFYAAGLCIGESIGGGTYTDWYLPAICEMGYGSSVAICQNQAMPLLQNMQSNLVDFTNGSGPVSSGLINGGNILGAPGYYWSSTEVSGYQLHYAWSQQFVANAGAQSSHFKSLDGFGIRCVRVFTP